METFNHRYKVHATVLTPLSIGQGAEKDWVEGIDYVTRNGRLYRLSLEKMADCGIDMNLVAALFAASNGKDVTSLLGSDLERVSDIQMDLPCQSANPIKAFCRNQLTGKPVLCGSSLKGAIRSAIFNYLTLEDKKPDLERNNPNEIVFGKLENGEDFMRFIRVSDFEFDSTVLVNTKIFNLRRSDRGWEGGWKHGSFNTNQHFNQQGFNTIYECLAPKMESDGNLVIATGLFDSWMNEFKKHDPYGEKKNDIMHNKPNEFLCNLINDYTFNYLNKEAQFFYEYEQGERAKDILKLIDSLQTIIDNLEPNECVIKMAAGTGFHSITGDWQYKDYTQTGIWGPEEWRKEGKQKYKSRKIAIYQDKLMPMGFIKLKLSEL